MKFLLRFLGLQVALLAALFALPVLADDSPGFANAGDLKTATSTPIVMKEEVGTFIVNPNGVVSSTVVFTFTNPTEKSITVPTIFPFYGSGPGPDPIRYVDGEGGGLKVSINGLPVAYTTGTAYFPVHTAGTEESDEAAWAHQSAGALFPITVPGKGSITVAIDFVSPDRPGNPGLDIYYYFASGAGWSGPIGKATFKVTYPYPLEDGWWRASATSTLSSDRKTITTVLSKLEPIDDSATAGISYWFIQPSVIPDIMAWRAHPNDFSSVSRLYRDIKPADDNTYGNWYLNYSAETIHALGLDGVVDAYWNMRVTQTIDAAGADSCRYVVMSSSTDPYCLYLFAKTYSNNWSVDQYAYSGFTPLATGVVNIEKYRQVLSILSGRSDDIVERSVLNSDERWGLGAGNPIKDIYQNASPPTETRYVHVTSTVKVLDTTKGLLVAGISFVFGALLSAALSWLLKKR